MGPATQKLHTFASPNKIHTNSSVSRPWSSSINAVQERHPQKQAILNLFEISGSRVVVNGRGDFIDAWQGVQDDGVRLHLLNILHRQDEAVLERPVFLI